MSFAATATGETVKRGKRTDPHRPGAIVPAEYEYVLSYNGQTMDAGWPVPSFGVNCELDRRTLDAKGNIIKNGQHAPHGKCCIVGLIHIAKVKFAATGGTNQCSVCGTYYVYGDVWHHLPTDEYIHIGHNCADKYELLVDRSEYELAEGRHRAAAAAVIQRKLNAEARTEFLAANPGLEEALQLHHNILSDLAAKFHQYRSLSPKQVALAFKIAEEVRNPKPEEVKVPAPTGKVKFSGHVVSVKVQEGDYGTQIKMLVKVQAEGGVWLAWGTAPAALLDATTNHHGALRGVKELGGTEVEISCTLEPGREPGFAFMKRPRGKLLKLACGGVDGCSKCQEDETIASVVNFLRGGA